MGGAKVDGRSGWSNGRDEGRLVKVTRGAIVDKKRERERGERVEHVSNELPWVSKLQLQP